MDILFNIYTNNEDAINRPKVVRREIFLFSFTWVVGICFFCWGINQELKNIVWMNPAELKIYVLFFAIPPRRIAKPN